MKELRFKIFNGLEIKKNKALLESLKLTFTSRECEKEDVLQYLDEDSDVICMYKNNVLTGFSWIITLCKELNIAELSWFVTNKETTFGLEGKTLLDYTIEYCKNNNIKELKFYCLKESWGRIKDKKKLFKKFGYNLKNEKYFDLCINTENNNLTK